MVHPDTKLIATELDQWCAEHAFPSPIITDCVRVIDDQIGIYVPHYIRLQASLRAGPHQGKIDPEGDGTWRNITLSEAQEAKEVRDLDLPALRLRAANRFSWHLARCALDFRTRQYTREQLVEVKSWFTRRCVRPQFFFLAHDVTAPHIHVERRDAAWRAKYAPVRTSV
jgi:hypothetical protein